LARVESFSIADRMFTIVGGVAVDEALLGRLARDPAIVVSLRYPGGTLSTATQAPDATTDSAVGVLQVLVIRGAGPSPEVAQARLEVTQSRTPLRALLHSTDTWFLWTAAATGISALLLAVWVSSRISGRLAAVAQETGRLDFDRLAR